MLDWGFRAGKSHLLIGLGTAAAEKGYRVKYTLATRLVNELVEAADEKILARTIARYGRVDLLCIDELGYMELDRRGAERLFQVLTEREEKNLGAITSNESFSGWAKTFTDPRLCATIPAHLRREHHRNGHRLLPLGPRPQQHLPGNYCNGNRITVFDLVLFSRHRRPLGLDREHGAPR